MEALAILSPLALLCTLGGFHRVVYFVSYGYGLSVFALCVATLTLWPERATAPAAMLAVGVALYGVRLTKFIWERDRKPGYAEAIRELSALNRRVRLPRRLAIWLACAALYVCMAAPAVFAVRDGIGGPAAWSGLLAMALGLGLEALADAQKSRFKDGQPRRFCDVGLYRYCRHPNYLGEIVFWCGVFTAGAPAYSAPWRWGVAGLGLICIVLIMLGSTRRLEEEQRARYRDSSEFQRYVETTPVLFPFVPLYTLRRMPIVIG